MTYFIYQRKSRISYWLVGKQKSSRLQLVDICESKEEILSKYKENEFTESDFNQVRLCLPVEKPKDPFNLYIWNCRRGYVNIYVYGKVIFNHKDKKVPLGEIKKWFEELYEEQRRKFEERWEQRCKQWEARPKKSYDGYRYPRTKQEKKLYFAAENEYKDLIRAKRKLGSFPFTWDVKRAQGQRSWKKRFKRKHQYGPK